MHVTGLNLGTRALLRSYHFLQIAFMPSFDGVLSFLSVFWAGCFKALLLWCAAAVIDALRNVAVHTAITADAALIENHAREQRVLPHGETGPSVQQDQGLHEPAAHR